MELHETRVHYTGYQELADLTIHNTRSNTESGEILFERERLLEEDMEMGGVSNVSREMIIASDNKRRERNEEDEENCSDEEACDPGYHHFLSSLKPHGRSYIFECKEEGLCVQIKYEGDPSLDKDHDVEPRRILRSTVKSINRPSDQMLGVENLCRNEKETELANKNMFKHRNEKNVKIPSRKLVGDPDYHIFLQCSDFNSHGHVYEHAGHHIVYELQSGKNHEEDDNDGSFDGVEVIDRDTFYEQENPNFLVEAIKDGENNNEKVDNDGSFHCLEVINGGKFNEGGNPSFSKEVPKGEGINKRKEYNEGFFPDLENRVGSFSKKEMPMVNKDITHFRQKVIAVLRKPCNEQEYDRLWRDIKLRKQEGRHLDLRNGREISYSAKEGKSYLDHYPAFRRKLKRVQHDNMKCLNMLRGFFFWLQQPEPPFCPWLDAECLAIIPESDNTS